MSNLNSKAARWLFISAGGAEGFQPFPGKFGILFD